jgi:hypothetical protein
MPSSLLGPVSNNHGGSGRYQSQGQYWRKTGLNSGRNIHLRNYGDLWNGFKAIGIQWVIRLAGGNEYDEGTVPEPLEPGEEEPGEEEPGVIVWREWIRKSLADREAELGVHDEMDEEDLMELRI